MKHPTIRTLALALAVPLVLATAARAQPFPSFSNPTNITNPYYPVSNLKQGVTLGVDAGDAYRSEVTLLPTTRTITWAGGVTQTRIEQFVAYLNGDLVEVAYDYLAQADNGDVYYFAEDVFNYADGVVVNTNGTWLAGRGGAPPGVIMPANPFVGQIYHPENFRPVVWEEDTVVTLMEPTRTPLGPIHDGLLIHELLLDGSEELKVFARGFGQVEGREPNARSHVVLLNRNSTPIGQVPNALDAIESRAEDVLNAVPRWKRVRRQVAGIAAAWNVYRSQAVNTGATPEFVASIGQLIGELTAASSVRNAAATREAANDLRGAAVDLMNFYNPRVPADLQRLDVLQREFILDVSGGDWTAAAVEHAKAADVVWARLRPFVLLLPGGACRAAELDESLAEQAKALAVNRADAAIEAARDVLEAVEGLGTLY